MNRHSYTCKCTICDVRPGYDKHAIGSNKITMQIQSKRRRDS